LKYIKTIALLTLTLLSSFLPAQVVEEIVAVVEDNIILKSDVDLQMEQAKEAGYYGDEDLACEVLNQLIIDKIFIVQAGRDSIVATNEEVDNELNRRIEYFISMFGSNEKLEEYYGKSIFDLKEEFRNDIYQQLLSDKMKNQVFADLEVSPAEVFEFFELIPADSLPYFSGEVEIGQIVIFATPTILQKQAAKEQAEKIRKDIEIGSDFGFQALLYSDDPGSAAKDGALGYVKRGELVPEFEAVAFRLEVGEISEVVETDFGFHIIQLLDRKGDRIDVRHILITPDIENQNIIDAEQGILDLKMKVDKGEMSYQQAVSGYSQDDQSKQNGGLLTNQETGNTFFEMSQLEGNVALSLDGMKVGEFSEVLPYQSYDGQTGFRIIYLQSESPAHIANLNDDYSKIKAVAKQTKQSEEMEKWLAKKAQNIYIRLSEKYQSCNLISTQTTN
jgi:peptidyl-prolyl cis-trans isomerase SurA